MKSLILPLILVLTLALGSIACGGVSATVPTTPARDAALVAIGQATEKLNRAALAGEIIAANMKNLSPEAQAAIREPLDNFRAGVKRAQLLLPTIIEDVEAVYATLGPVIDLKAELREVLAAHAAGLVPWLELLAGL